MIDVVVGMQYGDEGKGASAVMLHRENKYAFSARTGGSQAEHRFKFGTRDYRMRVLPCICSVDNHVNGYLTAGMIIRPDILRYEIEKYRPGFIGIDHQACVVGPENRATSQATRLFEKRGGYGMGISNALIDKIQRKDRFCLAGTQYPRTVKVNECLLSEIDFHRHGLIEASQGALLSIDHGDYPYVTSYNVTAPAVLAAAGIGTKYVRHIYGIVRAFPMRVAGESGSMLGEEIDFETIEKDMDIKIPEYRKYQTDEGGSAYAKERIARFSAAELKQACILNTPDSIILTHADWVKPMELDRIIDNIAHVGEILWKKPLRVSYVRHGEEICDYDPL